MVFVAAVVVVVPNSSFYFAWMLSTMIFGWKFRVFLVQRFNYPMNGTVIDSVVLVIVSVNRMESLVTSLKILPIVDFNLMLLIF